MALPELRPPTSVPCFLLAGHGATPNTIYADVTMRTGSPRRRRTCTTAPRVVTVAWVLEADAMAAVDAWFEDVLLAGEREFSARVKAIGPGLLWWTARWIEPYSAEALHLGRWRVTGQLLLTGEGQVEDPYSPDLAVEFGAALRGTAVLIVVPLLAVEFGVEVVRSLALRVEFGAAVLAPIYLRAEFGTAVLAPIYLRAEFGAEIEGGVA